MARIDLEDLPLDDELAPKEQKNLRGGQSCSNNLKQLSLAAHNYEYSRLDDSTIYSTNGFNFLLGDGSVR